MCWSLRLLGLGTLSSPLRRPVLWVWLPTPFSGDDGTSHLFVSVSYGQAKGIIMRWSLRLSGLGTLSRPLCRPVLWVWLPTSFLGNDGSSHLFVSDSYGQAKGIIMCWSLRLSGLGTLSRPLLWPVLWVWLPTSFSGDDGSSHLFVSDSYGQAKGIIMC